MEKGKHVLPGDDNTVSYRVKREAAKQTRKRSKKTIYGPDNEVLSRVNMETGKELIDNRNRGKID